MIINPFQRKKTIYILPLLAAVFVSLYFRYGVIIASDTQAYLTSSIRVSPLYPALISLFRLLFGTERYLNALVLFQEILLAYTVYSLCVFLGSRFSLSALLTGLLSFAFSAMYLLRLFIVGWNSLFCNMIMTEALTYPLFYLFVKYAFSAWDTASSPRFLTAVIIAFLLAIIRGQLISLFPVLVILFFLLHRIWKRNPAPDFRPCRTALYGLALGAAYFLGIVLVSAGYHFATTGRLTTTTMGKEAVFGAVLYNCDASDMEKLDHGSEDYALLSGTMQVAEADGLTYRAASGGPKELFRHYESSHDELRSCLLDHISSRYGISKYRAQAHALVAEIAGRHMFPLMLSNLGQYLKTCAVNAFGGLVRSNSILNTPGILLSAVLYAAAAVFLAVTRKKETYKKEQRLLLLILIVIFVNAVFCSFGVFELSRYVFYSFPCFYSALFLCFLAVLRQRRRKHSSPGDPSVRNLPD